MLGRFCNYLLAHWYQTFLLAILISFAIAGVERKGLRLPKLKSHFGKMVFIFYLSFLLILTVFSRKPGTNPFTSVFANFWPIDWEEQQNIAAFVPLTFLYLSAYESYKPMVASIYLSSGLSSFIELSQMIGFLGAFQFSDILYNTVGGALGCGLFLLVRRSQKVISTLSKKRMRKKRKFPR